MSFAYVHKKLGLYRYLVRISDGKRQKAGRGISSHNRETNTSKHEEHLVHVITSLSAEYRKAGELSDASNSLSPAAHVSIQRTLVGVRIIPTTAATRMSNPKQKQSSTCAISRASRSQSISRLPKLHHLICPGTRKIHMPSRSMTDVFMCKSVSSKALTGRVPSPPGAGGWLVLPS